MPRKAKRDAKLLCRRKQSKFPAVRKRKRYNNCEEEKNPQDEDAGRKRIPERKTSDVSSDEDSEWNE